jgi:Tfp pilus assembly protein PilZ
MENNLIESSLEEAKTRIAEIVSTMSETELEKFLTGLEKWQKSKFDDERGHARKDISIFATFWSGGYFFSDHIKNISASGLFLETNIPVAVGGTVTTSFSLSENAGRIKVEGEIVRVRPNGFGMKFNEPLLSIEKEITVETTNRKKNSIEEVHSRTSEIISSMSEIKTQKLLKGLEKWQQSKLADKREHSREHTSIYAFFETNGLSFKDSIKNLSAGGLFIETGIPLSVNRELFISFLHPDYGTLIKVAGEIVRTDSKGIGVKFDQPRSDIWKARAESLTGTG